jgi:predicted RNA polymerase sigma factor
VPSPASPLTRDLDLAEDLAQEALVAALEQWPQSGVPDNSAAWLTATAKRRAIDLFRGNAVAERELETLEQTSPDLDSSLDNTISDDILRLVFIACHPILPTESRAALTSCLELVKLPAEHQVLKFAMIADRASEEVAGFRNDGAREGHFL